MVLAKVLHACIIGDYLEVIILFNCAEISKLFLCRTRFWESAAAVVAEFGVDDDGWIWCRISCRTQACSLPEGNRKEWCQFFIKKIPE